MELISSKLKKGYKLNEVYIEKSQENQLLRHRLDVATAQLRVANEKIDKIYSSQGWIFLGFIYRIRDLLIPKNSLLRNLLKKIIVAIRFINLQPPKRIVRKINTKSKKVVFIDHSYHTKTASTDFILDYLKKYFEIEIIFDDSWQGEKYSDLSHIDSSYHAVIFLQSLPNQKVMKQIQNQNIIFFPMYDGYGNTPLKFWRNYPNLKIINFSKTLHKKMTAWGFDSIYIQYFPKPLPYKKNKTHKVFFWQRINKININLLEQLLSNFKTKIHMHQLIDPEHIFVPPTKIQEKKFGITYSSWFSTREEMQEKVQECDIYVAPRDYEGIGLSFLEAMAMGKAVVAVNNPTMNEYINDCETGYLYNLENPLPICFSNLEQVRRNTYLYMKRGWGKWQKEKQQIIEFIHRP